MCSSDLVGIGAIIITAIYWLFGFLRMGTTGLTAQAIGSGDKSETSALLVRGLIIGLVSGLILIVFQVPLFFGALQLSPASIEVEGMAQQYLHIRVYSAPAAIAIFGITGWLIAKEKTRAVLLLQLLLNGVNIILEDRKSTRLNSSHKPISYAVFCLKKKTPTQTYV